MADLTFDCPECSHELVVDAQAAGMVVACPECGAQLRIPALEEEPAAGESGGSAKRVGTKAAPAPATRPAPAPPPEIAPSGQSLEYKVVSMLEGEGDAGKLTADAVEFKLNELLQDGWQLRSSTAINTRDWLGNPKQEILLILVRPI